MFTRVLTVIVLAPVALLAVIAVVAAPATAFGGVVFGAFLGILGVAWIRGTAPRDAADPPGAARRTGVRIGAGATAGWLTLTGLVLLLGSAAGPVLLALVVLALALWSWRRPRWPSVVRRVDPARPEREPRRPGPPSPDRPSRTGTSPAAGRRGPPVPPTEPVPVNLSTHQLCLAWQRTYFALVDLPVGPGRNEVAALRGRLLDEMERRDPQGFTRWLDTGARASSDPGRYLGGDRRLPHRPVTGPRPTVEPPPAGGTA